MDPLTTTLALAVLAVLVVVAASALGERLGVAAPLLLVGAGVVASLVPGFPAVEVEPEWVLAGLLPPLLYSAAVSVPAMDLRRELSAVSGLSVVLVVLSSFALGGFFALVVPGLGLAWGVALGAVVSPTDAVATSIARRLGVPARAVTILDGEGLLNDATALVVLRAAIAAAATGVSLWGVAGRFVWAVAGAALIGVLVGRVGLWVRSRLHEVPATTALSFAVPFVAAIPAELAGASGLVAAVLAGLTTGWRAPRVLSPGARLSDAQNWGCVEMLLEGAVFLLMGLQLVGIVRDVQADHAGVGTALGIAAGALLLTVVVRAVYVSLLLLGQRTRTGRAEQRREVFARLHAGEEVGHRKPRRTPTERQVAQFRSRGARALADLDHLLAHPLDARQGAVVVWAGMRGAITLAAAQTLPAETPARPLLLLVAVAVAVGSLLLQGATLPWVVRRLLPGHATVADPAQWDVVRARLDDAAAGTTDPVAVLDAQRAALLDERDLGRLESAVLTAALAELDADQIALEVRARAG
ncbi:cation:proton antiporter [Geodermatophilus sp. Leaf369]|uniref:cation:proton antiporter n=1 Tax=Geodermatophilus sp. Leaf369 TaxID=1736354 RepID=UPI000701E6BF|nr:cation:proton antiporter [Geodermatophilus sp. Leaf369]KQS56885.1 cation:proton antiporter [Geodermatophilus sp. Leaf369]